MENLHTDSHLWRLDFRLLFCCHRLGLLELGWFYAELRRNLLRLWCCQCWIEGRFYSFGNILFMHIGSHTCLLIVEKTVVGYDYQTLYWTNPLTLKICKIDRIIISHRWKLIDDKWFEWVVIFELCPKLRRNTTTQPLNCQKP